MTSIQRDEDVADNSRLGLCNGSVILSGNSPQGSVIRSSIESVGPTNASTILAGIFDDYLYSSPIDTSEESKYNSLMNRNITIEEEKIGNLAATSSVTLQRKTRTVTPIKEIINDFSCECCGTENEHHNNDTDDLRNFDLDSITNESECRIITHIKTPQPACLFADLLDGKTSDRKYATQIENLTNNFLTLLDVENNRESEKLIEFREDETADLQNDSKIEVETNFEHTIVMKDIGALIEFGNNSPAATRKNDSKFSDTSTVFNDFSNKTSNCTVPRNSRFQISDWNNNEDSMMKHPRLPRYITTPAINLKRSATRLRSSRSPMKESVKSCTSQKVCTVSELIDKYSKLSAANKVQNSPRIRRPPNNARRSLFNISTRGTVLAGRKSFRVNRSPNKSLHPLKGSGATSTLQEGKPINQRTMKPVGCSYIGRTPSKLMQASGVDNRTSTVSPLRALRDSPAYKISGSSGISPHSKSPLSPQELDSSRTTEKTEELQKKKSVQEKKSSPSTSSKSLLKFPKRGLVTANKDSAKPPVDKDNNYTVAQLIHKFSNVSSETKIKNCMPLRKTVHDVKKSSNSSMRATALRRTPNSPVNRSSRKSPVPTEGSSSTSSLRRGDAQSNPQIMKRLKYSHNVKIPSKSVRSPSVDKTKVAPTFRGLRDIRANKGFSIPKILIHSPSGLSPLELDSAPLTEEAVVSRNEPNNSPQYKDENVNEKRSLTPEYSGLRPGCVRKKKLPSVPPSETSLFKIRKTGLVKRNHKSIKSPVRLYIRGASIGVFEHFSVKSAQTPPIVKSSLLRNAKLKSQHLAPDALNTAILL